MAKRVLLTVTMKVEVPDNFPDERVGNLCLQLDPDAIVVDSTDCGLVEGASVREYSTVDCEVDEGG